MSNNTEITIPVGAVYLLDPSGIPLFARYYQGNIDKTDSTLLGGFFSAIEIFVKTSMDGLLSDIGMTNSRFFFDRTPSDHIIVIIVFTDGGDFIDKSSLNIVKSLQKTLITCFEILVESANQKLIKLEVLIESLGTAMDSFILENSFEFYHLDNIEGDYYESIKSEELTEEEMEKIIEMIKMKN